MILIRDISGKIINIILTKLAEKDYQKMYNYTKDKKILKIKSNKI